MGKVGEEIATEVVEEKLKATVFKKDEHELFGPDREILIDGDYGILEAKLRTSKQELSRALAEAIDDVYRRFEQSDKYKKGIAFSTYLDKDTGQFEYIYKVVIRGTQDTGLDQISLTTYWTSRVREPSVDLGDQNQPMTPTFVGFYSNQRRSSDIQYSHQQMMFGTRQERQKQQGSKTIGDTTNAQSMSKSNSTTDTQDTVGVGSKQWSSSHSQAKKQGLSNQSSEIPIQVREQEQGNKTSKARDDRQQTIFEGREGPGKTMAQQEQQRQQQGNKTTNATSRAASEDNRSMTPRTHNEEPQTKYEDKKVVREDLGQQRQRQGQQAKQQGDKIAKKDAEPSNKNGKSDSQQTLNRGSENAKDSNRSAPSNGSKGDKDQDTKSRAPSHGGRSIPI